MVTNRTTSGNRGLLKTHEEMPIFKDIRLLWFSALTFSKDGCPFQAEWQLCKRNAGKRRGGIKSLLACLWKWDTARLTVIHLSGIKTAEWHFQPRRRRGRITLSRCVCSRATRGVARAPYRRILSRRHIWRRPATTERTSHIHKSCRSFVCRRLQSS